MIGSVNEQEIPTVALENMMESGVTALVIDFTTGPDVIGQVSLDSEGYSTYYDMQNPHTSVCLNVGSRGDLTSFTTFDMSFETNREFTYYIFPVPEGVSGQFSTEAMTGEASNSLSPTLPGFCFACLVIIMFLS